MTAPPDKLDPLLAPETRLASFVLRFVCDRAASDGAGPLADWHGVLRHVQSNRELHFTRWEEAVAFISQHVDLHAQRDT